VTSSVRAVLVVMLDVAAKDTNKLLGTHDQQLVQALPADRADPALGDRVGVGRPHGCADDLGTGRAPHVIERPGELGVPVADQEPERSGLIAKDGDEVAGLLGNPEAGGMVSDAGKMDPPPAKLDEEQHIYPPQEDRVDGEKSQARIPAACWRRNDRQFAAPRRGAGSRPWARRILRIELADTRQPRRNSSPWMRW
jgi:hypothetical protein